MELHSATRLKRARSETHPICEHYLDRLALAPGTRAKLSVPIGDRQEAIAAVHDALAGKHPCPDNPAHASVPGRLRLACDWTPSSLRHGRLPGRIGTLPLAPPLKRSSMVPHPWTPLNPLIRWRKAWARKPQEWIERKPRPAWPAKLPQVPDDSEMPDWAGLGGRWLHYGRMRRLLLLVLVLLQTGWATWFMSKVLPYQGETVPESALLALFAILFCWVSAGFWTALAGFGVMLHGTDRFLISRHTATKEPIATEARTAIIMPICNEDVTRVMAGLRATYESLARTGELNHFDFFVLSDSSDPDTCVAELAGWTEVCRAVDGFGRIFYRRRRRRVKRKSGNIDDFCRRWGKNYRYMVVLDADSVMSGDCLSTLVRLMEANPGAGIIQTAPRAVGRDTLYARIQQFAAHVYSPLFTAGMHYWQLGESHYWGHNAIIRVDPFIRHCALAPLPGRGVLAGEILSHDFVEAALMRRAGWGVWIAYDLDGSYEEMPPTLLDELKRDRRWCHGNLMNFRLLPARGMHPVHRVVFITGVMAYLSAPLWFLFLALSTGLLALHTLVEPQYFVEPRQLFPLWPHWDPQKAIALFSATATLLFLPKILAVLLACKRGARLFGGRLRIFASMLLEMLFSMLLAPVRMLFHTWFVAAAFLGWEVRWRSPPREDAETTWIEATRKHGLHVLLGLAWGSGVFWLNPAYLLWLMPIAGALVLSVPISVWSSRVLPGRRLREAKLFAIPEELETPPELVATRAYANTSTDTPDFTEAVVDPLTNALVCAAARPHPGLPANACRERTALIRTALRLGPSALSQAQRHILLDDPLAMSRLHFEVWISDHVHADWRNRIANDATTQK